MLYVNTAQSCGNTMNELFILERNNDTFWKLEGNKDDEFWNKTRTNSFLEMGKSSSNVSNVFKVSSLTGQRIHGY